MILVEIISLLFTLVIILLILRLILEIVSAKRGHPIVAAIFGITEPIVRPFRGMIRSSRPEIIAIIFAIIAVAILQYVIVAILSSVIPHGK